MIKKKQTISLLIIPVMLAFIVASSVCLQFLTMTAMASEMASAGNTAKAGYHEMGMPGMAMDVLPVMAKENTGCHNVSKPIVPSDTNYQPFAGEGVKDCCINKGHHPDTLGCEINFGQGAIASLPLATTLSPEIKSFNLEYKAVYLPPPETDSLRSIVKNE